jgi:hypothetical protein
MGYKFTSGSVKMGDIHFEDVSGSGASDMYIDFDIAADGMRSITHVVSGSSTMKVLKGQVEITNTPAGAPTVADAQLILKYDDGDFAWLGVDANGGLMIETVDSDGAIGDIIFNPDGNINFWHKGAMSMGNDIGSGDVVFYGGGTTEAGKLYYLHSGSSNWLAADADSIQSGSNQQLGIALGDAPGNGIVLRGFFDVHSHLTGTHNPGQPIYVSRAAGKISTMQPSGSGNFVRIIGHCGTTGNVVFFNPQNGWIELA